mmetsp:Transcript_14171/g.31348  ORF Transcript_14171/g.31348 Transcript_14171/m.31348 type:complete len:457 (-) Transcript_14171:228-1598(-)
MAPTVSLSTKLAAEFIGTFLLVFTVGCNVLSANAVWGGVSIACVLMVSIYALGGISGANFNPAVTLSIALSQASGGAGMDWKTAGMYMGVQFLAGLCASISYSVLFWNTFNLAPAPGFGFVSTGLCELLYTFMLCFVVLNVAVAKGTAGNSFYGLAIGFVIIAGAYGAGSISGGCFNPAVAIGIDVASAGLGFGWCIYYVMCEFLGAAAATGLFMAVRPEDFGKEASPHSALVSEFLGTFMLILTVGLNVLGSSKAGAFSIAASLMSMIYALGDVSGAHFNPAVTVAILVSGRCEADLPPARAGAYIGAQLAAGLVAGACYTGIYGGSFAIAPGASHTLLQASIAELVFTFVLCFVVLAVAVSSTTKDKTMFGLAIGSCVTVGGNAIGAISGGSLNPAVTFGLACAGVSAGQTILAPIIYCLVELAAGAGAAVTFKATHSVDLEDSGVKDPLKESV